MTLISNMATRTLFKRSQTGFDGRDYSYSPDFDDPPEAFACVFEPGYSDAGRDLPEVRNGRIITETEIGLRDLIYTALDASDDDAQEVTGVNEKYDFDGSVYGYEVFF